MMTDLEKYIIARWAYSIGEEYITNSEYTLLDASIRVQFPTSEYVQRSWSSDSCPLLLLRKYHLQHYITKVILTDKTESIPSMNTYVDIARDWDDPALYPATLSYKHDGWNTQISYLDGRKINAQTRGRSADAMPVDRLLVRMPNTIPDKSIRTIVGETTVGNKAFVYIKDVTGNVSQRMSASTCLSKDEYIDCVDFHAFDILGNPPITDVFTTLQQWGFKTPTCKTVYSYEELLEQIKVMSEECAVYDSPTDGLVVRSIKQQAIRVERWEEPIYQTYVTGYEETYGPHKIGVKCMIYPIQRTGSKQVRVPVTNYQRVIDNNLRKGYPLAFRVVSGAIADLDEESTRLLQRQWEGKYDTYRAKVEENERLVAFNQI